LEIFGAKLSFGANSSSAISMARAQENWVKNTQWGKDQRKSGQLRWVYVEGLSLIKLYNVKR